MNAFNKLGEQILELFNSMTLPARFMAALMVGIIVISLGWILSMEKSTDLEYLMDGRQFSDEALDNLESAFGEATLRRYKRDGKRMLIPSKEKDLYVKAIMDGGAFPKEWGSHIDQALKSSNPFEATSMINTRLENAEDRELAVILERITGIEKAYVHHGEKRGQFGKKSVQSCSICLEGVARRTIEQRTLDNIRQIASTYYPGIDPLQITVTDLINDNTLRGSNDPGDASQNPYLRAQREAEEQYRAKIENVLESFGPVKLGVFVNLDPTLHKEMETLKYEPTSTTLESVTSRKDMESSKPNSGGRPGAEPNAISNEKASVSQTPDQLAKSATKSKESEEKVRGVAGREVSLTKQAPFVPTRVSVTVGVPDSYYTTVWNNLPNNKGKDKDNAPQEADLIKLKGDTEAAIRSAVTGQLPAVRQGDDKDPLVTVYTFPDLPGPTIVEPTTTETAMAWLKDSWSTLALLGVVLVSLGMMFSWVRSQAGSPKDQEFSRGFGLEIPADMGDSIDLGGSEGEQSQQATENSSPKFEVTGGEIKTELSGLIKQNPEAAVNLLRTWIGEAA